MAETQTPYGFTMAHTDILTAALGMEQEPRLGYLLAALRSAKRDVVIAILSEFIGLARSAEANALDQLRLVLQVDGKMYERGAEQVNIPSILGALEGSRRALLPFPGMCGSCAFRRGTIPNQCLPTQEDVQSTKDNCANFMCHEILDDDMEPTHLCAGFARFTGRDAQHG